MKLLFLDTETTGLNPNSGQIIELGAILATLDPKNLSLTIDSHFEELVSLRSEMDERITRITGITNEELSSARPLHKVQESWFNFLQDCPEDVVIIGHSLQFDLDFLKAESWFLPKKYKVCDTLELSKILLPDCNAVNLEFLVEKLALAPTTHQLDSMKITSHGLLKAHRALYDTTACMNLTARLLTILKNSNFDQNIYRILIDSFLPIDIIFFSTPLTDSTHADTITPQETTQWPIYFNGQIITKTLFDKINDVRDRNFVDGISDLLTLTLPKDLLQVLLQIYVITVMKIDNPSLHLKIHGRSHTEFLFADQVYQVLSQSELGVKKDQITGVISQFEGIISQIKHVSEYNYKLTEFITLLELYEQILKRENPESLHLAKLQELIACYDFLLLNLQQFWQKSEYYYVPNQLKPEEQVVQRKITELYHLLSRFNPNELVDTNLLLAKLKDNIIREYATFFDQNNELQIAPSKRLLFRNQGLQISISTFVYHFNLNDEFAKTIDQFKHIILQTYLTPDDLTALLKLTGLKEIVDKNKENITIDYLGNPSTSIKISDTSLHIKLADFLEERKEIVDLENKFSLLLCGQNSSLKEIERALTQEYDPSDYFVLGESGSLTKIVSKMIKNQKGIVAVKNGDFYYISRYLEQFEIGEIWVVNQPYFPLHKYWQSLALNSSNNDEYTNALKWLYLKSQIGFISAKTGLDVHFLKSYRV
jgi:DNA polymerase III epsilon subunit-like protein